MNAVVVHYKELALKGKNRPWFIQVLIRNLKTALAGLHVRAFRSSMGRLEIELGPDTPWPEAQARLARVFGIANYSMAGRGPHDFDALAAAILADVGDRRPSSFRVSATRADKRLPFTSPQVEREVGGLIKEATGWHVDLSRPALTIHVEMLPDGAFYFFGKEPGAGGLPTGTGGRVACLLSGGIDSPVAAYRLMLRIAERIARRWHARALVTGEVIGQVASQTLENMATIADASTLEVLRPLVGMDKDEITSEAQRIGTYPISIIPDQDCCTLFTPRHPATRARVADATAAEQALPIAEMVDAAVEAASKEEFRYPVLT